MENLHITETFRTPEVDFDVETGNFLISGRSIPENPKEFYKSIFDYLAEYFRHPAHKTILTIRFDYFNSASARVLYELLKRFDVFYSHGNHFLLRWVMEEESFLDLFESVYHFPIEMIKSEENDEQEPELIKFSTEDKLIIHPSFKTPSVHLNRETGIFEINGYSIPENPKEFYNPIFEFFENYFRNPNDETNLSIHFEYFNSSSSKCLTELLKKFNKAFLNGKKVSVTYFINKNDEDIRKDIQEFCLVSFKMPIHIIEIDED